MWAAGFFSLAASAVAGAIFHGAGPELSEGVRSLLRNGWLLAAGFAGGFLISGVSTCRVAEAKSRLYAGCLLLGLGAVVLAFRFGFHQHFNHNDLFHLLVVGTLGFWWEAGRRFSPPGRPSPSVRSNCGKAATSGAAMSNQNLADN